jgi:hypothetical protein
MNRLGILITMCLTVAACDKKEVPTAPDSAKPSVATEATAAPPVAAAAPPAIDLDTLPVEEDFEAEAEKELTLATLTAKLDDLDKAISTP